MLGFEKSLYRVLLALLCLLKEIEAEPICVADLQMAEISTSRSFIKQALAETNLERANHGVPPLVLNEELGKISQYWANRLANTYKMPVHTREAKEYLNQSGNIDCGENIYMYHSSNKAEVKDGAIPVRDWYDEIYYYDFRTGTPKNKNHIGHFAQSVWKATEQVGFALSVNPEGQNFVVATYKPPGNWEDEFIDNVLLPKRILAPIRGVQFDSPLSGPKEIPPPTLQLLAPGPGAQIVSEPQNSAQGSPVSSSAAAPQGLRVTPRPASAPLNPVQAARAPGKTPGAGANGKGDPVLAPRNTAPSSRVPVPNPAALPRYAPSGPAVVVPRQTVKLETGPICAVDLQTAEISTNRSWIDQALAETNLERANHGVPAMVLNEELGKISQYWANMLATKYKKPVNTRDVNEYGTVNCGESIYVYQSSNKAEVKDGAIPVREWYDEIYDYDFQKGSSKEGKQIVHFAQSVWKATVQVGFAWSINREGQNFVVATYKPEGNLEDQYMQNVLLPKSILAPIRGVRRDSPLSGPTGYPPPTLQFLLGPGKKTASSPRSPVQGARASVKVSTKAVNSKKAVPKTKAAKPKPATKRVAQGGSPDLAPEQTFKSGTETPIRGVQRDSPPSGPTEYPPPTLQFLLAPGKKTASSPGSPVQGARASVKVSTAPANSKKAAPKTKAAKSKPATKPVAPGGSPDLAPEQTFKSGTESKK